MGKRSKKRPSRKSIHNDRLKRNVKHVLGIKEPKLGDRGQRYEVWINMGGEAMRAGWAESIDSLVGPLARHPGVQRIVVIDRMEHRLVCCTCGTRSARTDDIDKKYCPTCAAFLLDPKPDKLGKAAQA